MTNLDPEVTSSRTVHCRIVNPCDNLTPESGFVSGPKRRIILKRTWRMCVMEAWTYFLWLRIRNERRTFLFFRRRRNSWRARWPVTSHDEPSYQSTVWRKSIILFRIFCSLVLLELFKLATAIVDKHLLFIRNTPPRFDIACLCPSTFPLNPWARGPHLAWDTIILPKETLQLRKRHLTLSLAKPR